MYFSFPTTIGSLAAAFLVFFLVLTLGLRLLPAGRPFLGHVFLVYRGRTALAPTGDRVAPVSVRAVFVLSYLVFAATGTGVYMWKELGLFQQSEAGCIHSSCMAASDITGPNALQAPALIEYKSDNQIGTTAI